MCERVLYAESIVADRFGWAPLQSERIGDYKFIKAPHRELYRTDSDPHELHNIVNDQPALASMLETKLRGSGNYLPADPSPKRSAGGQAPQLLEQLGYFVRPNSLKTGPASDTDPKERIPVFTRWMRAYEEASQGRTIQAARLLREAIELDKDCLPLHESLARFLLNLPSSWAALDEAEREFKLVLAADPHNAATLRGLATVYMRMKHTQEAIAVLAEALKFSPQSDQAQFLLGQLYEQSGRLDEAAKHYSKALSLSQSNSEYLLALGSTYFRLGKRLESELLLRRAVQMDPENIPAHYALSVVYLAEHQTKRGADEQRKAAEMASGLLTPQDLFIERR